MKVDYTHTFKALMELFDRLQGSLSYVFSLSWKLVFLNIEYFKYKPTICTHYELKNYLGIPIKYLTKLNQQGNKNTKYVVLSSKMVNCDIF